MSAEIVREMQRAGSELAEALSAPANGSNARRFATVKRIDSYSADIELAGAVLSDIPITLSCLGASPGDRAIVEMIGTSAVLIGVLAKEK